MIQIENYGVCGWEPAIRGMRNPMNSWDKSDTIETDSTITIGPNDLKLMRKLADAGPVHAKYRRMLTVYLDITAPLYWFKEFDTCKVGTVANSCSTMHKIHSKPFTPEDFSHDHLLDDTRRIDDLLTFDDEYHYTSRGILCDIIIPTLNFFREKFLETKDKRYWWQLIQLLPSSYNQKRTVMLNYEVLSSMYRDRHNHKLDEWRVFCDFIKTLPYSELITGEASSNPCTT